MKINTKTLLATGLALGISTSALLPIGVSNASAKTVTPSSVTVGKCANNTFKKAQLQIAEYCNYNTKTGLKVSKTVNVNDTIGETEKGLTHTITTFTNGATLTEKYRPQSDGSVELTSEFDSKIKKTAKEQYTATQSKIFTKYEKDESGYITINIEEEYDSSVRGFKATHKFDKKGLKLSDTSTNIVGAETTNKSNYYTKGKLSSSLSTTLNTSKGTSVKELVKITAKLKTTETFTSNKTTSSTKKSVVTLATGNIEESVLTTNPTNTTYTTKNYVKKTNATATTKSISYNKDKKYKSYFESINTTPKHATITSDTLKRYILLDGSMTKTQTILYKKGATKKKVITTTQNLKKKNYLVTTVTTDSKGKSKTVKKTVTKI